MIFVRKHRATSSRANQGRAALAIVAVVALSGSAAGCGAGGEGASTTPPPADDADGTGVPLAGNAPGVVEVRITEKGYEPARIPARINETVTLRVTRTTERTCATELIMKDPPLRKDLPLGKAVEISLTPSRTGEIAFSCAMDMIGGVIDVR